jgi:mRNA interferase RelE/StbE
MKIVVTARAKKDLEKLDDDTRKRVYTALEQLITGQRIDIKKLKASENYRIRVGDYRVIIAISKQAVAVYTLRVLHRREVYER